MSARRTAFPSLERNLYIDTRTIEGWSETDRRQLGEYLARIAEQAGLGESTGPTSAKPLSGPNPS